MANFLRGLRRFAAIFPLYCVHFVGEGQGFATNGPFAFLRPHFVLPWGLPRLYCGEGREQHSLNSVSMEVELPLCVTTFSLSLVLMENPYLCA